MRKKAKQDRKTVGETPRFAHPTMASPVGRFRSAVRWRSIWISTLRFALGRGRFSLSCACFSSARLSFVDSLTCCNSLVTQQRPVSPLSLANYGRYSIKNDGPVTVPFHFGFPRRHFHPFLRRLFYHIEFSLKNANPLKSFLELFRSFCSLTSRFVSLLTASDSYWKNNANPLK